MQYRQYPLVNGLQRPAAPSDPEDSKPHNDYTSAHHPFKQDPSNAYADASGSGQHAHSGSGGTPVKTLQERPLPYHPYPLVNGLQRPPDPSTGPNGHRRPPSQPPGAPAGLSAAAPRAGGTFAAAPPPRARTERNPGDAPLDTTRSLSLLEGAEEAGLDLRSEAEHLTPVKPRQPPPPPRPAAGRRRPGVCGPVGWVPGTAHPMGVGGVRRAGWSGY
jgi:hypothetical protein